MKTIKKLAVLVLLGMISHTYAQQVNGKITINKASEARLELEDGYTVNLFKAFKEGDHQLVFFFEGRDYAPEKGKPEFNFFKFKTTVKHNGKTIKSIEREPMPYIPGDMWLPAEAFDFVNILAMYEQKGMGYRENTGTMPKGEYEIILEAIPVKTEGNITKGLIMFNVK